MSAVPPALRAVLFDLDDTLYDHSYAQRSAVAALHAADAELRRVPLRELLRADQEVLDEVHRTEVLTGRMPLEAARELRMRRLYGAFGIASTPERRRDALELRQRAYREHERAVPGALRLLAALHEHGLHVGVVSNNLLAEQRRKLEGVGLAHHVDALTVSEEVGVAKPEAAIFLRALERVPCAPGEAVMVGDSWEADVVGARGAGLGAVWFARGARGPPRDGVVSLGSLVPARDAIAAIRSAVRPPPSGRRRSRLGPRRKLSSTDRSRPAREHRGSEP